jgi:hypothetical protein
VNLLFCAATGSFILVFARLACGFTSPCIRLACGCTSPCHCPGVVPFSVVVSFAAFVPFTTHF